MGHDHHFLSRLDRVDAHEVELALTLYRDHALVKHLLRQMKLPEGADRVALALTEGPEPPHIVLQRDGHFVTCLAEGMGTNDLVVVPRRKIDDVMRGMDTARDQEAALREIAEKGGLTGTVKRLLTAGPNLSREEMIPIFRLAPLLRRILARAWDDCNNAVLAMQNRLQAEKKLGPRNDERLEVYWQAAWGHAHVSLVLFHDRAEFLDDLPADAKARSISVPGLQSGFTSVYLRTLAATAKAGKHALPLYRALLKSAATDPRVPALDCAFGLTAIAVRHRGLRAEITKLLKSSIEAAQAAPDDKNALVKNVEILLKIIAEPEKDDEAYESVGRELTSIVTRELPVGSPLRFEKAEDVPRELAFALGLYLQDHMGIDPHSYGRLFVSLSPVSRAAPEDLYMPAKYLPVVGASFHRERVAQSLEDMRRKPPPPTPSSPRRPGRNEPCSCGSGKKYKRCCGA